MHCFSLISRKPRKLSFYGHSYFDPSRRNTQFFLPFLASVLSRLPGPTLVPEVFLAAFFLNKTFILIKRPCYKFMMSPQIIKMLPTWLQILSVSDPKFQEPEPPVVVSPAPWPPLPPPPNAPHSTQLSRGQTLS